MYNTLLRLYTDKSLTTTGLKNAVEKNWISPEQYQEIIGEVYTG